jgi:hypothetical protein
MAAHVEIVSRVITGDEAVVTDEMRQLMACFDRSLSIYEDFCPERFLAGTEARARSSWRRASSLGKGIAQL